MIPAPDPDIRAQARDRLGRLAKPVGALGALEDIAVWCAGVQGRCPPEPFRAVRVVVIAGDHGVATTAATSAYSSEVTAQMVATMVSGGAAVNVLARDVMASVQVVDASVDSDYPGLTIPATITQRRIRRASGSIDRENALTAEQTSAALDLGRALAEEQRQAGADLVIVGDMGIGNTTPAAALIAALGDEDPVSVTGRGTGIDDATWMRKVAAVRDALWRSRELRSDPSAVLETIGGADLAVMAGLLGGCAQRGIPVLLDGVVVTAAALVADRMDPGAREWWWAGHRSAEPAHSIALAALELTPVLDLEMRLGEGTGALTALPVVNAAAALLGTMATLEAAGISSPDDQFIGQE